MLRILYLISLACVVLTSGCSERELRYAPNLPAIPSNETCEVTIIQESENPSSQLELPLPPELVFVEQSHDFGKVKAGEKVSHKFEFVNTGNAPLEIGRIKTSCGCTVAKLVQKTLASGESSELEVVFSVGNNPGQRTRTITVASNDPAQPTVNLTVTADVIAKPRSKEANLAATRSIKVKSHSPRTSQHSTGSHSQAQPQRLIIRRPRSQ